MHDVKVVVVILVEVTWSWLRVTVDGWLRMKEQAAVYRRSKTFSSSLPAPQTFEANPAQLSRCRYLHPRLTNAVADVSNFYDFSFPGLPGSAVFKRPVTLKLPTPDWIASTEQPESQLEVAVICKNNEKWERVENALKITKVSIAFDTKVLGR